MTLIVGGINSGKIWLVGDTMITGPALDVRRPDFSPKIELSADKRMIAGYAGAADRGPEILRAALAHTDKKIALGQLISTSKNWKIDFMFGYLEENDSGHLYRIKNGTAEEILVGYIGSKASFEAFQRIRLGECLPYAPEAFKQLMVVASKEIPEELNKALAAMIDLFASRGDRDVGGWATPFVLSNDYAAMLPYSYAVSDPCFAEWQPGSVIPHGTPDRGGSTLSVTLTQDEECSIIYWLQKQGGYICRKTENAYELKDFQGDPSAFKRTVEDFLKVNVDIWIGDCRPGPLHKILVKRGPDGALEHTVGFHGNSITFAVHNMSSPFTSSYGMDLTKEEIVLNSDIKIARISNEKIKMSIKDESIEIGTSEIEHLISRLGAERSNLHPKVPSELKGISVLADVDPAWRVDANMHPALAGATLALRHKSFGWQAFVLPIKTARSLGAWLSEFAAKDDV